MSQPYVGEIRMVGFNFPVNGWAFCNGQLLSIAENDVLFNLIGTTYGGDGQTTFGLPDLQGRVPVHQGPGFVIGQKAGIETVTLTQAQMAHTHTMMASTDTPAQSAPLGNVTGAALAKIYRNGSPTVTLNPQSVSPAGGSQPHENMQPFLAINFIISLFGVFPSQN